MTGLIPNLWQYRELVAALAWKNVAVRYKQSYMGILWAVLKPVVLVIIFVILRSIVGIDSGTIPYPVLTYCALTIWIFFQESASEGVNSVVGNTNLIRKIYFPREVFPLTSVVTKLVELCIGLVILAGLMAWYGMAPNWQMLWIPALVLYAILAALTIAFVGAALNVYYRDIAAALPVLLSLMMYMSPVIYPLQLVRDKLLVQHAGGDWSQALYLIFTLNPLAGLIDAFQNVTLRGLPPDAEAILPGLVLTLGLLPFSYLYFKRAEAYFADVI
ncbi:MAG: lipopolysaccharide transport system permease protein [Azoarcus sp.]|uniref:Transport permease protein n=1 Tax=Aromatoleum tolulyticum TaxID=34027 RepID=A0A1N6VA51_9RHOO|nr:ABC transporter permease [Aromatoleum tolulyticum]MCK9985534.1 lipopolysaccharide transport system permease protein [Azoarcus sp.]SIQ74722.1 lipopolysaccharide transport system permease protein [Aromatoleum tolulyticum]